MKNVSTDSISVIGLGKVGLTLTVCLGEAGYRVIGVDVNAAAVEAIQQRRLTTNEPGVSEGVKRLSEEGKLEATQDLQQAVRRSGISFVVVATPSNARGGLSLRFVQKACEDIAFALREKQDPHIVVVVSTLLPGVSEVILMPRLEKLSGRRIGETLGYCYNPAFIALGDAVQGFVKPDFALIGQSDPATGQEIVAIHQKMIRNHAPISTMTPTEAEIAKLVSNTHDSLRVSFANMLLSMCMEISGVDVDRIVDALSPRIGGKRFMKGGMPYGGPCWPKENSALCTFLNAVGVSDVLPEMANRFNEGHGQVILRVILSMTAPQDIIGVLGLAYKPRTPVIEHAFGVRLAAWLVDHNRRVVVWDPLAMSSARELLGDRVSYAESANACIQRSQAVVINMVGSMDGADWQSAGDRTVIDPWRCLAPSQTSHLRNYRPIGRSTKDDSGPIVKKVDLGRLRQLTE